MRWITVTHGATLWNLDPASGGAANNDDTQITLGLNDMGTLKVCVSEGVEITKNMLGMHQLIHQCLNRNRIGITYPGDAGAAGTATIQYHTPELPFGTKVIFAYNTNMAGDAASGNAAGSSGNSKKITHVVTSPVDGLTLSAHYNKVVNDYDDGTTTEQQLEEGGSYALKYAAGNFISWIW